MNPRAWLLEPQVQRHPKRPFIRGIQAERPSLEQLEFAKLDGDRFVPLYDESSINADLQRLRGERAVMAQWIKTACGCLSEIDWGPDALPLGQLVDSGIALVMAVELSHNAATDDLIQQAKDTTA